ncbi:cytosolic protein [Lentibacillus sediminis]|uniref:cytosolic protein n=1 Tax=Lentibacillus sediminis TaxID=1940529 RepID=UPI000C1B80CD|nr:cytosolic protein [Lentibacillus sediminis]
MAIRHTINKYFNNHAETMEKHWDEALQTRYYKTTKDKAMQVLEEFFRNSADYELHAVSKEHGEISVYTAKGKKTFIVTTVIMVRPYRTAVDFSVTTESAFPFDFGHSTKVIKALYTQTGKELPLIEEK